MQTKLACNTNIRVEYISTENRFYEPSNRMNINPHGLPLYLGSHMFGALERWCWIMKGDGGRSKLIIICISNAGERTMLMSQSSIQIYKYIEHFSNPEFFHIKYTCIILIRGWFRVSSPALQIVSDSDITILRKGTAFKMEMMRIKLMGYTLRKC